MVAERLYKSRQKTVKPTRVLAGAFFGVTLLVAGVARWETVKARNRDGQVLPYLSLMTPVSQSDVFVNGRHLGLADRKIRTTTYLIEEPFLKVRNTLVQNRRGVSHEGLFMSSEDPSHAAFDVDVYFYGQRYDIAQVENAPASTIVTVTEDRDLNVLDRIQLWWETTFGRHRT